MSGFDMSSTIVGIMGLLAIALLPTPYGVIVAVGAIVFCWGEIYSNRENIEQVDMVALVMGVAFLVGAFIGHTHLMVMFIVARMSRQKSINFLMNQAAAFAASSSMAG